MTKTPQAETGSPKPLPRDAGALPLPLPGHAVDQVVTAALAEDSPWGDLTSQALIPAETAATAFLTAREEGVFCGEQVLEAAFRLAGPGAAVIGLVRDGERFDAGGILAEITGPARTILAAERVALNLAQRLSGIATLTARFVAEAEGTRARIADTRKTTPGLRALERYAVRCGGGSNHRHSLSDAVMAKDNHLAILASMGADLASALRQARDRLSHTVHFEVEVDSLDQIEAVLAGGADTVLLDNFSVEDLRRGVETINGRALTEASGNVRLDTVAAIAATGVDIISAGALTHSVRALDLGLDIRA
ncbi:carboxylating nicotinate-nucleotide diphosphorylase [Arthrobacter gandavensis]|uniref:carboxylating nicotinate-nucleotide diphosphorylase n=1 Tax=Arthrobacter gandavensis TaxID=169960 RepID=UPI0018907AC7|nr:carboxylating nicotinate-nucleotide diphosphorylase [Arthrobacter gandavensis]MBF4993519.1 carboxylating nicotinate-nucleotide diphosphorylase [Arthrobacter gandavensis]